MFTYRLNAGNLSESDEVERQLHQQWKELFNYYFKKGEFVFITYWEDFYIPTPNIEKLKNIAIDFSTNEVNQRVIKLPTSNEVNEYIVTGATVHPEVLISYFHIDIRDNNGKRLFSSEDNGIVVLLEINEDEINEFEKSNLQYSFIKLDPPVIDRFN